MKYHRAALCAGLFLSACGGNIPNLNANNINTDDASTTSTNTVTSVLSGTSSNSASIGTAVSSGSNVIVNSGNRSISLLGINSNRTVEVGTEVGSTGTVYRSSNTIVAGGFSGGQAFAGISGFTRLPTFNGTPINSGNYTYNGRYGVSTAAQTRTGALTLNADFANKRITGFGFDSDGRLSINSAGFNGSGAISGEVTYSGAITGGASVSAPLQGGFYGVDSSRSESVLVRPGNFFRRSVFEERIVTTNRGEIAGAFSGDQIAGTIQATRTGN